jgi:hypothetical protein
LPALDLFLSNRKEWNHAIRVEYVIFGAKITTISGVLDAKLESIHRFATGLARFTELNTCSTLGGTGHDLPFRRGILLL